MTDVRDALRLLEAELARREGPGIAKAREDSFRDRQRGKAHAEFCAGVQHLLDTGWSRRQIADRLDCHVTTLITWFESGHTKRDQLPGWVLAAMPSEAQPAMVRVRLGWSSSPPPGRTGTDG